MAIRFLLDLFEESREREALLWRERSYSYGWLLERVGYWGERLRSEGIAPGAVAVLEGDFSPDTIALLLALIDHRCILVPLERSADSSNGERIEIAEGEVHITVDENDDVRFSPLPRLAGHELYMRLRESGRPGLVLFSSGSTGRSKAALHDLGALLEKFRTRRHSLRTLGFLLFDHIGGLDTLFYVLSNGSCFVVAEERSPSAVCRAVEQHRVEVLPTSPTFLNLLLISRAYVEHDLSSLKIVTYGTEVMPESTLRQCVERFPNVEFRQKYGMTEVGAPRSRSRAAGSLWVRIGGEGFQTRVVDGILQIKARSAMLGYLNAPSPFTEDGWLDTEDAVERDGEYLRFLGRRSEIINVGGRKVFPAEVESVIQEAGNVREAEVYGEKNAIVGSIVCAKVVLEEEEDPKAFTRRLTMHCRERLAEYKIPLRITLSEGPQHSDRFKKKRG